VLRRGKGDGRYIGHGLDDGWKRRFEVNVAAGEFKDGDLRAQIIWQPIFHIRTIVPADTGSL
jgi:hypothetical protein